MGRGRFEPLLTSRSSPNFTKFSTSNCTYIQGLFTYFWKCNISLPKSKPILSKIKHQMHPFPNGRSKQFTPQTTLEDNLPSLWRSLVVRRTMNVLFESVMECSFLPSTGAPIIPQKIARKYICSRAWDYQIWHQQRTWMSRVQELFHWFNHQICTHTCKHMHTRLSLVPLKFC